MIVERNIKVEGYASRWYTGTATLILPLGHGEYRIQVSNEERVHARFWCPEKDRLKPSWVSSNEAALGALGGNYVEALLPEGEGGWGELACLSGSIYFLWNLFYRFSNTLDPEQDPTDYTPGGDDDTFDYYPSAFECLAEWAKDMDTLDEEYGKAVQEAAKQWPEHMQVFAQRARHAFSAQHRVVSIVNNLRVFKGPFEEWEFEGYAAPYLVPEPVPTK